MEVIRITTIEDTRVSIFASLKEPQLLNINAPAPGLFIAETPMIIERALRAGYVPVSVLAESDREEEAKALLASFGYGDVTIYIATPQVLAGITGYKLIRGMLCAMERRAGENFSAFLAAHGGRRLVLLEDVVNPTNLGAIFRSAAAMGMDGVILSPGCTDPLYRRAARVSMGTVFQIPWVIAERRENWPEGVFKELKERGYAVTAMALLDDTLSIEDERLKKEEKLAVLLGSEGPGLRKETLALCDYTVKIPMYHGVDSLNVAAASAVAFFELMKGMPAE